MIQVGMLDLAAIFIGGVFIGKVIASAFVRPEVIIKYVKTTVPEVMTPQKARQVLALRPDATQTEVRLAWYKQVQLVHPDRGGSLYLCQLVNSAYSKLTKG